MEVFNFSFLAGHPETSANSVPALADAPLVLEGHPVGHVHQVEVIDGLVLRALLPQVAVSLFAPVEHCVDALNRLLAEHPEGQPGLDEGGAMKGEHMLLGCGVVWEVVDIERLQLHELVRYLVNLDGPSKTGSWRGSAGIFCWRISSSPG